MEIGVVAALGAVRFIRLQAAVGNYLAQFDAEVRLKVEAEKAPLAELPSDVGLAVADLRTREGDALVAEQKRVRGTQRAGILPEVPDAVPNLGHKPASLATILQNIPLLALAADGF